MATEHDRERILKGAESFFDELLDGTEDVTLDQFMIVGIVSAHTDDDSEVETPVAWCSSQRIYVQIGILETMLVRMKSKMIDWGIDEDEED